MGGGCMCRAVRYEATTPPSAFFLCHCRECQYVSGGEPASVLVFPSAAIRRLKGELSRYVTVSEAGNRVTRLFCPTCGTPVFSELEAAPEIAIVKAGTLDDARTLKPQAVVWTRSANAWAHLPLDLPHFEGNP